MLDDDVLMELELTELELELMELVDDMDERIPAFSPIENSASMIHLSASGVNIRIAAFSARRPSYIWKYGHQGLLGKLLTLATSSIGPACLQT